MYYARKDDVSMPEPMDCWFQKMCYSWVFWKPSPYSRRFLKERIEPLTLPRGPKPNFPCGTPSLPRATRRSVHRSSASWHLPSSLNTSTPRLQGCPILSLSLWEVQGRAKKWFPVCEDFCWQVEAEVESKSRNKIHQTWGPLKIQHWNLSYFTEIHDTTVTFNSTQ